MKLLSFGEVLFDVFSEKYCLGGAPLNLAAHITAQGYESTILSSVGNDELGATAITQIKKLGIDTSLIKVLSNKETGKCIVTLDENAIPCYSLLDNVAYDFIDIPKDSDIIQFDTFAFGTLALRDFHNQTTVEKILNNTSFDTVFVDLNLREPYYSQKTIMFCLENATILKLSSEEYPIVSNIILGKDTEFKEGLQAISKKFPQIKIVIYTLGEYGAYAYNCNNNEFIYCEAEKCNVVSTVGAGDSFSATFLAQYADGKDILTCLKCSSKLSAFVVSHNGAIPDELNEFIKENIL